MRFVKINTAEVKSKICNRKCIASATAKIAAKVDICTEITKNLDIKNNLINNIRKLNIKERFSKLKSKIDRRVAAAAIASSAALVLVIIFNMNFTFAYNAFIGDTQIGFVTDKKQIDDCMSSVNSEFAQYVSGEDIVGGKVVFVPAIIKKSSRTDEFTLCENIKSTSDVMVKSFAVEVDGIAFAALNEKESADAVLNQIKAAYKTDDNTQVSFKENVQVIYEYVPSAIVMDSTDAFDRLKGSATFYNTVKVDSNITFIEFAENNGLEEEYLKSLNPQLGDMITTEDSVVVPVWKSVITVLTTDTVSYEAPVPFDEQVVDDATIYEGSEKIITAGQQGINSVTEKIKRENGAVVSQTVISSEVVSAPVTQMRAVGTKERPANMGTGTFIRPYGGSISSRFGSRSLGNHKGIDICGNVGDAIHASDNGTVVYSDWMSGYGYLIQIDHNNGYVTYYGHCNELYAKVGDVVKKGDVIAALGNTGRSTGPHVHFEVRYNGQILNPLNHIK